MGTSAKIIDKKGILGRLPALEHVAIELGCGQQKLRPDVIGIDRINSTAVDIVADLEEGLCFLPSDSVDTAYAVHSIEHLKDIGFIMAEIHRVLRSGGRLTGSVPHFTNPYYYSDYTHQTPFGLYTFSYFADAPMLKRQVPRHYISLGFTIKSLRLVFYSPFKARNALRKLYGMVFNLSYPMMELYESDFCHIIPAHAIEFELEKK